MSAGVIVRDLIVGLLLVGGSVLARSLRRDGARPYGSGAWPVVAVAGAVFLLAALVGIVGHVV